MVSQTKLFYIADWEGFIRLRGTLKYLTTGRADDDVSSYIRAANLGVKLSNSLSTANHPAMYLCCCHPFSSFIYKAADRMQYKRLCLGSTEMGHEVIGRFVLFFYFILYKPTVGMYNEINLLRKEGKHWTGNRNETRQKRYY
ncbi:hypothetical protein [Thalassobacillus pellis]|uniref:hypothetical protein n=1 Tax=Thalassobacillus pellis TaxID=748008 RepID=UPI00196104D4|nr:hypothetical protein [Thalassobacillus pellis]MBM7554501.1 hypothetical protein [Thalassobacillus pellis]